MKPVNFVFRSIYCSLKIWWVSQSTAFALVCAMIVFSSCKKEEVEVYTDNEIPPYNDVSTLLVQNYVNRLYIDLIGREPTDAEMSRDVAQLRSGSLSLDARRALVQQLMFSEAPVDGDLSYAEAFYRKFYEDQKGRYLNGASEAEVEGEYEMWRLLAYNDSLNGNMIAYQVQVFEAAKVKAVLDARLQLRAQSITCAEMHRRMMFNSIYDDLNMNTFNFINATFDDSFGRFPTEAELSSAFPAVENSIAGTLFGSVIASKVDYLNVFVNSVEYREGLVRWMLNALLSRDPSTAETVFYLNLLGTNLNFTEVQKQILITDEYAGFDQ